MAEPKIPLSPELQEAYATKLNAEAVQAQMETRKLEAEARDAEAAARRGEIKLLEYEEKEKARLLDDDHLHVYRFFKTVTGDTAQSCITELVRWSRIDPGSDITIIFDSPGGSIIDGFHLFDTILWLRGRDHEVTTVAQGMAASMAGILLQAGDHRIMTPQSSLLIHEAQFAAMGSYGKVEDMVEFIKKLQQRILDIFAARSKMPRDEIESKWHRKDWWMMADEALEHGFCDEVSPEYGLEVPE